MQAYHRPNERLDAIDGLARHWSALDINLATCPACGVAVVPGCHRNAGRDRRNQHGDWLYVAVSVHRRTWTRCGETLRGSKWLWSERSKVSSDCLQAILFFF